MAEIDERQVEALDKKLISEGFKLHQRPFHVVMHFLKERGGGDVFDNDIWPAVKAIYKRLYPNGDFGVGSLLTGGVAFRDQFYLADVSLGYGTVSVEPLKCIRISPEELEVIWKGQPEEIYRAIHSVADLWDFSYGVDDLRGRDTEADALFDNCKSQIQASALTLSSNAALEASVQSSCLTAELGMKGALAILGVDEKGRKALSHNLGKAAEELCKRAPGKRDDMLIRATAKFPPYIESRYEPHGLTRVQLNDLAMRAQFIAAEAVRRVSGRNLVDDIASSGSLPPRRDI